MSVYNRKGRPVFGHLIVRINSKLVKTLSCERCVNNSLRPKIAISQVVAKRV